MIDSEPGHAGKGALAWRQKCSRQVLVECFTIDADNVVDGRHLVLVRQPNELMHQLNADWRDVQQEIGIDIVDLVKESAGARHCKKWRFHLGTGPGFAG